ncbi:type IV pilin protein [Moraxella oblonga]|uniref:type IV pilin protein n=1 Tax=Moraxella oblonga TaxID=200413 RepID=UPI00082D5C84|nr:type IV pilin protein [Moraxella oblonga]
MKKYQGFTVIELLMVLVILSIITAFAVPSYQEYTRKKDRAVAQQEMQKIAADLERFRGKNFTYKGFTLPNESGTAPQANAPVERTVSVNGKEIYTIKVTDNAGVNIANAKADGFAWRIYAERTDPAAQALNYDLLMTSVGERCMTQAKDTVKKGTCGDNEVNW